MPGSGAWKRTGLAYDILIHPRHLPVATEFVSEFPNQRFVLDHLAKPCIARRELEPWTSEITELARRDNVSCKLSGMVTEARWKDWGDADFEPYLDTCLEAFGEDRILFGSDWPVCLVSADYCSMTGILTRWSRGMSESARAKLFGENAERVYSLS